MWVALHVLNPEKWGVSVKLPMGNASYVNFQFVFLKFNHGGIFKQINSLPLKRIKFFGQIIKNFQGVTECDRLVWQPCWAWANGTSVTPARFFHRAKQNEGFKGVRRPIFHFYTPIFILKQSI